MRGPPESPAKCKTLGEVLARAARSEEGIVLVDARETEETLPWRVLHRKAEQVAQALAGRGVTSGDRVALVLPTGEGFLSAFFGAVLAGAIPVPLYPPLRLGKLSEYHAATARMLTAVGARLVISDRRVRRLLGQSMERARPELGCVGIEALAEGGPGAVRPASSAPAGAVDPDGPALIQFSSGSTVDPKPVVLTHRALMAQLSSLEVLIRGDGATPQVGASWLPLYHDMGLIGALLLAAYYPGKLVLLPPELFLAKPAAWLRAISRHRATVSPAPSFAYALCTQRIRDAELEGLDLSSWTMALDGAEPVSCEVMRGFRARFGPCGLPATAFMPVYGLSEAALAVTFSAWGRMPRSVRVDPRVLARSGKVVDGDREIVSVGTPVPGVEVELRGPTGARVSPREVGRIWVRTPSVMRGYFGRPEATAEALVDGWLDTGDLGFVEGGQLYVHGRAKDLVIIRGANHDPREFEEALVGLEGVRAGCAVAVGFLTERGEEALLVLAERARDGRPEEDGQLEARIRSAVLERTSVRPHTVRVLEPGTLPRTSSGKLRRQEALRAHSCGALRPPNTLGPLSLGRELLRSAVGHRRSERGA